MSEVPMKLVQVEKCETIDTFVVDEEAFDLEPSISREELMRLGMTGEYIIEPSLPYSPPGFVTGGFTSVPPPAVSDVPIPSAGILFFGVVVGVLMIIRLLKRV